MVRQPEAGGLELMGVELGRESENFLKIHRGGFAVKPLLREARVILHFESFNGKGIAPILRGLGQMSCRAEDQFAPIVDGERAERHHHRVHEARTRRKMAAPGAKIDQVRVIEDHNGMGLQRPHRQIKERLFQRERMPRSGNLKKIRHVEKCPADLLMELVQERRLSAAHSARKPEDGANGKPFDQFIERALLRRAKLDRGVNRHARDCAASGAN